MEERSNGLNGGYSLPLSRTPPVLQMQLKKLLELIKNIYSRVGVALAGPLEILLVYSMDNLVEKK